MGALAEMVRVAMGTPNHTIVHLEARKDHEKIVAMIATSHLLQLDTIQASGLRCHPFGKRCARSYLHTTAAEDEEEAAAEGEAEGDEAGIDPDWPTSAA